MLKGIPDILSPDLLKILHEMGHGDDLVVVDANFPAASTAKRLVRYDGHGLIEVLEAILKVFPLDSYADQPVSLMQRVPGDTTIPEIHEEIIKLIQKHEERGARSIGYVDRFIFYEKAKNAYAIIATTERKLYGCVIIKKGVIT